MRTPKAPPPPDYAAAAREQGVQNLEAARTNTLLQRPNEVTPWGSQTWTRDPSNPDSWTRTVTLSPEQQALYEGQNRIDQSLLATGERGLSRVGQAMETPFDMSGLPVLSGGPSAGNLITGVGSGRVQRGINTRGLMSFGATPENTPLQDAIDTRGLTTLPGTNDFGAERTRVEDAVLSRFERQTQRDEESLRQRLANQGITPGSEAWNREFETLNQGRNDARMQAILAGGSEQSRLFDMASRARGQEFGERSTEGAFTNASRGQRFQQGANLAQLIAGLRGQQFGERTTQAQFGNQAEGQRFAQQLAAAQFGNQADAQRFGQELSAAQFGNQARQQGIQEQAFLRQLPLNELNALRTGAQVQAPQFQAFGSGQTAAAPVFQATQAQDAANMQRYQQQLAGSNNFMSGLFGLGGAALQGAGAAGGFGALFSDRRLKTNVERIGTHESGLPLYRWDYVWGEPGIGVMADEAEVLAPTAVLEHASGFKAVDYEAL